MVSQCGWGWGTVRGQCAWGRWNNLTVVMEMCEVGEIRCLLFLALLGWSIKAASGPPLLAFLQL